VTSDTNLHRCLGIVDLIVVGVGGMIGSGIYVMTGITAKEQTGLLLLLSDRWVFIAEQINTLAAISVLLLCQL